MKPASWIYLKGAFFSLAAVSIWAGPTLVLPFLLLLKELQLCQTLPLLFG